MFFQITRKIFFFKWISLKEILNSDTGSILKMYGIDGGNSDDVASQQSQKLIQIKVVYGIGTWYCIQVAAYKCMVFTVLYSTWKKL